MIGNVAANAATSQLRQGNEHWRTQGGGLGGSTPPPPKLFRSFDKAEPNSQFHGKHILMLSANLFEGKIWKAVQVQTLS
jgi:hypothetical protein